MLILGIETSCDETAVSIVKDGREVLSNTIASQNDLHAKFGGVVPEIASRAHIEKILPVIQESCEKAQVSLQQIDAVAVGNRPGLIGSLLVGVSAAKALAWSLGVPLIDVDHVQAHLYAGALNTDPILFPALGLVASGGHSNIYSMTSPLSMTLIGRTIDDAIGEAYDKVAAILELGFPGGPILDKLARSGDAKAVDFPRTLLSPESLDFSFSGLKTAVLYHVRGTPQGKGAASHFVRGAADLSPRHKADIAAAFQRVAVKIVMIKLERAMQHMIDRGSAPQSLVIGGGVSANSHLRQSAIELGAKHKLIVKLPAMSYCIDNAAMIAGLAYHRFQAGHTATLELEAVATTSL